MKYISQNLMNVCTRNWSFDYLEYLVFWTPEHYKQRVLNITYRLMVFSNIEMAKIYLALNYVEYNHWSKNVQW